jgi:hypothetical protein
VSVAQLETLGGIVTNMKRCTYCGSAYPDDAVVCSLDQRPLTAVETDARAATAENMQFTDKEIVVIAKRQKAILWLIAANLVLFIFESLVTFWIPFTSIVTGIIGIAFIYRLGRAVHSSAVYVYVILAFIPFVGLVGLFILNARATRILREHRIHVGVMGARSADLHKLIQSSAA